MNDETNPPSMGTGSAVPAAPVPPMSVEEANLAAAVIGGLVAAVVGGVVWAVITVTTKFQIGFMAVGVGFLVAWAVRTLGKGRTQAFGIIGAVFAFLGCILGNLLSACGFIAADSGQPVMSVASKVLSTPSVAADILQATFSGMDLLFYGIAVYEGYKLARRSQRS
jgi:hypothetical protein